MLKTTISQYMYLINSIQLSGWDYGEMLYDGFRRTPDVDDGPSAAQ